MGAFTPLGEQREPMKRIAFIINPISGNRTAQQLKDRLPELVLRHLDASVWSASILHTAYAGHATELAAQLAEAGYDAVVAVGGDGTVSEVASGLRDTRTAMGILPMGSGNGLARHLGIPLQTESAIRLLNRCTVQQVDYGLANEQLFVCSCGTGLDAVVADQFAKSGKRGFVTYIRNTIRLLFTYHPQQYRLTGKGMDINRRAFLITFANANQWGNGALIAPRADIQDGLMDIMIMSPHALWGSLGLAIRLFAGTIDRSRLMTMHRADEVNLIREQVAPFHIDGDPVEMPKDIHIRIIRGGLRVLVAADC